MKQKISSQLRNIQKRKCSSHKLESKQRNRTETQHKANHKTENKEQTEKHNRNIQETYRNVNVSYIE